MTSQKIQIFDPWNMYLQVNRYEYSLQGVNKVNKTKVLFIFFFIVWNSFFFAEENISVSISSKMRASSQEIPPTIWQTYSYKVTIKNTSKIELHYLTVKVSIFGKVQSTKTLAKLLPLDEYFFSFSFFPQKPQKTKLRIEVFKNGHLIQEEQILTEVVPLSPFIFEKALNCALQMKDDEIRIFAICNIAETLIQSGMDKKATEVLLLAMYLTQKLDSSHSKNRAFWSIAKVLENGYKISNRIELFRSVMKHARTMDFYFREVLEHLVVALEKAEKFPEKKMLLVELLEAANTIHPSHKKSYTIAFILSHSSTIDFPRKEMFIKKILDSLGHLESYEKYILLHSIVTSLEKSAKIKDKEQLLMRVLEIANTIDKTERKSSIFSAVASTLNKLGKKQKSMEAFLLAVKIAEIGKNEYSRSHDIALITKEMAQSGFFKLAEETAKKIENWNKVEVLIEIAVQLVARGKEKRAIQILEKALLAINILYQRMKCSYLVKIADVFMQMGEEKKAQQLLFQAFEVAKTYSESELFDSFTKVAKSMAKCNQKQKAREVLELGCLILKNANTKRFKPIIVEYSEEKQREYEYIWGGGQEKKDNENSEIKLALQNVKIDATRNNITTGKNAIKKFFSSVDESLNWRRLIGATNEIGVLPGKAKLQQKILEIAKRKEIKLREDSIYFVLIGEMLSDIDTIDKEKLWQKALSLIEISWSIEIECIKAAAFIPAAIAQTGHIQFALKEITSGYWSDFLEYRCQGISEIANTINQSPPANKQRILRQILKIANEVDLELPVLKKHTENMNVSHRITGGPIRFWSGNDSPKDYKLYAKLKMLASLAKALAKNGY